MSGPKRQPLQVGATVVDAKKSSREIMSVLLENVGAKVEVARAEGHAAGQGEALQQLAPLLDTAVQRLDEYRDQATQEVARDIVELAVEIARQLVQCKVNAEEYDLERMVRGALDAADTGRSDCTVHLAPADYERLSGAVFREGTRLVADPEMQAGDVQVSTSRGLLVRELDSTLDSIREQLLEELV